MFCGEEAISITRGSEASLHKLRCRSWHCDDCMSLRLKELADLAATGNPNKFLTLTTRYGAYPTPDEAARALVRAWRNLVQRAKRENRIRDCQYLAVFEQHKSGWPHLHVLARMDYLEQDWISKRMAEYCDGPNVWIEAVHNQRHAAFYIAKYVSKGPEKWEGCKRYWRSQGYAPGWPFKQAAEALRNAEAQRWSCTVHQLADWYRRAGWNVEEERAGSYHCSYRPGVTGPLPWEAVLSAPRGPPVPCRWPGDRARVPDRQQTEAT